MSRWRRRTASERAQGDLLAFRGNTTSTKHAGWTGARQAVRTLGEKTSAYLQLLNQAGALTDHEAAELMHVGLSTINSIRNNLIDGAAQREQSPPIVPDGFDLHTWGDGGTTKRTRWTINRAAHPIDSR